MPNPAMKPGDLVRVTQRITKHRGFPEHHEKLDLGLGILMKRWENYGNDKRTNQIPIWEVLRGEVTDICSESALELISGNKKDFTITTECDMVKQVDKK